MIVRGEVEILEEDARRAIQSMAAGMLAEGRIGNLANTDEVLHALSAHHTLERIDYPSVTFRFQHQLFQEFYAARFLGDALGKLVKCRNEDANKAFAAKYINMPMWEEPLRMVAEEIRQRSGDHATKQDGIDAGICLVTLSLPVDPILASELCRLCGPAVWGAVRGTVGETLRDWRTVGEPHHQQLALSAMLATGSDDFTDVLVPLLSHKDRQVRISTYEAGNSFHLTSLGTNWRWIVDGWGEDARADFVSEVTHRGLMADIGESFAITDSSAKVRNEAIQELSWISAADALTRVAGALDDFALDAALPAFFPETLPEELRPRFVAANRRLFAADATPLGRIRRLLQGVELGDTAVVIDMITELSALAPPLDQYAEHAINEALKIVKKHDATWVSTWVTAKLLEGTLLGDHWRQFLLPVSQPQADELIDQLATRELGYRDARALRIILSSSAVPGVAAQVFCKLCALRRAVSSGTTEPLPSTCIDQLRDELRAMPVDTVLTGMMPFVSEPFDQNTFRVLIEIFGELNADAQELRSELPDILRQPLRRYLKAGIERLLRDDLFDDGTRSRAAIALARIGNPEDLIDLRRMIDADIMRQRSKSNMTTYANWFVEALLMLGAPDVDIVLIDLLREEPYEGWAARGLAQLALPPSYKPWLTIAINFEAIWETRAGMELPGFDETRAKRYAKALRQRIEAVEQPASTRDLKPQPHAGRVKSLAVVLAALDGQDCANFVIDILALPGQWDAHLRVSGIRAVAIRRDLVARFRARRAQPGYRAHTLRALQRSQRFAAGRLPGAAALL